jgi:hypothetical protein
MVAAKTSPTTQPPSGECLTVQVRDRDQPTMIAGRYLEHDGRQYLYSWIAAKGILQSRAARSWSRPDQRRRLRRRVAVPSRARRCEMANRTVQCSDCMTAVEEPARIEDRKPCPNCGSIARMINVTLTDTAQAHERLGVKMRHGEVGKVQPFREQISGDDFHRDSKQWRQVTRVIDREHDRYTERIIDATGNVVRDVEEPLSQHRGHGAAKRRAEEPPAS